MDEQKPGRSYGVGSVDFSDILQMLTPAVSPFDSRSSLQGNRDQCMGRGERGASYCSTTKINRILALLLAF